MRHLRNILDIENDLKSLREEDKGTKLEVDLKTELAWETGFSNMQKLLELSREALGLAEKLMYEPGKAYSFRNLAYYSIYTKYDMKKGADYLLDAIEIFEKYNLIKAQADCWDIFAGIYNLTGNYDTGLEYSFKSLSLYKKVNNKRGEAWAYHNLGVTYSELDDLENSRKNYEKALDIFREINYVSGEARMLSTLGLLMQKKKEYCSAKDYFDKAIEISQTELQDSLLKLYMGALLKEIGELKKSEEYLSMAYKCLKNEETFAFTALLELLDLSYQKGEYEKVINSAEKDFKKAYEQEINPVIYKTEKLVALSYEACGNPEKALEHYKKFYLAREEVHSNDKRKNLKNLQIANEIKIYEKEIEYQKKLQDETKKLLLKIFPEKIVMELLDKGKVKPIFHKDVSVVFTDFVGFTKLAGDVEPEYLLEELDFCFSNFDKIIKKHGLEKLKTIGDGYMAACGIPEADEKHAEKAINASLEIRKFMNNLKEERIKENKHYWDIRIGINSGPLVAGVIGDDKFIYDVWGDTVNTAAEWNRTD